MYRVRGRDGNGVRLIFYYLMHFIKFELPEEEERGGS
jgi:hypothetical protein